MRRTAGRAVSDARPVTDARKLHRSRNWLLILAIAWSVPMAIMCVTAFGVHAAPWPPRAGTSLPAWRLVLLLVLAITGPVALFLPLPLIGLGRDYLRRAAPPGSRLPAMWLWAVGVGVALEIGFGVAVAHHMAKPASQALTSMGATVLPGAFVIVGVLLITVLLTVGLSRAPAGPAAAVADAVPADYRDAGPPLL